MICRFFTKLMVSQRRKNRNRSQNVTDLKRNKKTLKVKDMSKQKNWILNIKEQLKIDEGYVAKIYLDSEGLATFGIGHLVIESDPEYKQVREFWPFLFDENIPVEGKHELFKKRSKDIYITEERIKEAFDQDLLIAINDIKYVFHDFNDFDDELKEILVNMIFNLGLPRFKGFKKMIAAIKEKNYNKAAEEMIDSKWYYQVGNRSKRLVKRMRFLASY